MAAEIHLQKSKTKGGVHTIPLHADALESAKQLVMRAQQSEQGSQSITSFPH
jgi:hypothetical protein